MANLTQEKIRFIEFMMESDVLRFGEFVTKSGRNTPYFVNTGNYKTGAQLMQLGKFYAALVKEVCGGDFTAMYGPAYKGIPLAAATAIFLAGDHGIDKPYFFNRKEVKDHGEGGGLVGYQPQNGDNIVIIEDVITAGTALRESLPILKDYADVTVKDMFISVNRCEVGATAGKTAIMEVKEEFGIDVHAIVTVRDIREYLDTRDDYKHLLPLMDAYMEQYCVL
ncbi:orotate phosphoribosyltransferase [Ruminococcaceae bacterium OttesenSCG-928-L11]|nr:orotate phosphoribosyltransferase [Ruminococcaceae bacterium OttesenSCG-928-L11]